MHVCRPHRSEGRRLLICRSVPSTISTSPPNGAISSPASPTGAHAFTTLGIRITITSDRSPSYSPNRRASISSQTSMTSAAHLQYFAVWFLKRRYEGQVVDQ
ncbi:hypothetical protein BC629DRAFT_1526385 [Irpex lacteus]|nr:hypothetical protein BC629DRAFT_1526385 [Irpex lacteus]